MSEKSEKSLRDELLAVKNELNIAKAGSRNLWKENTDLSSELASTKKKLEEALSKCRYLECEVKQLEDSKLRAIEDAKRWEDRYCTKGIWDCICDTINSL